MLAIDPPQYVDVRGAYSAICSVYWKHVFEQICGIAHAIYTYLQNNYVKAIANWSMTLAVSSKCSEHILLAQECVKASLAMLTNTSHLSWRADLVILEENICETTVLKFLLERDQKYDCCNRPRSTLACFLFS